MSEKFFVVDGVGIDEVGRGAVAGPVVACAVLFDESVTQDDLSKIGVDDSKALSAKKREFINAALMSMKQHGLLNYGLGFVQADEIDTTSILASTNKAMRLALDMLKLKKTQILVDGNINPFTFPVKTIIKGDEKCYNIGAASIIAKVARDKMMDELATEKFTCYNWNRNKGYASAEHISAIKKYGTSIHHRQSFCKKF